MNKIKFSSDYEKLPLNWNGTTAILIGVSYHSDIPLLFESAPGFKEYDTKKRGEGGNYNIHFREGIVLVFFHIRDKMLFTTIRSFIGKNYNISKYDYYLDRLFDIFLLELVV